jgi:hypothetical protein
MKLSKKNELITVSEPGTYTLQDLSGQCSGGVIEPSSCRVQLISPPALDMTVITLNEGWVLLLFTVTLADAQRDGYWCQCCI